MHGALCLGSERRRNVRIGCHSQGPPGRGAFLAAARQLLRDQPVEWMIVGMGTTAKRSYVKKAFVQRGTMSSVRLSVSVQAGIRGHLEETPGAEIINIHNHPSGFHREIKIFCSGKRQSRRIAIDELSRRTTMWRAQRPQRRHSPIEPSGSTWSRTLSFTSTGCQRRAPCAEPRRSIFPDTGRRGVKDVPAERAATAGRAPQMNRKVVAAHVRLQRFV